MREKRGQTPLKGGGHDAGEERGMQKTWSREIDQMETGIDISSWQALLQLLTFAFTFANSDAICF